MKREPVLVITGLVIVLQAVAQVLSGEPVDWNDIAQAVGEVLAGLGIRQAVFSPAAVEVEPEQFVPGGGPPPEKPKPRSRKAV